MKKVLSVLICTVMLFGVFCLSGCSAKQNESKPESTSVKAQGINYLVLVNKLNELPDYWEKKLDITKTTNSLGDEIEVETKAYKAYLELKEDLEKDGVKIDLDSARRSVAAQKDIVKRFTKKYGLAYVEKYVATPGYSEHHTGLALDLYLNINSKDVYLNEDMVKYPEIWAKIHEKLADHGFILRYLDGMEHITGYGYEPWHIRYIDDVKIAKEITEKGITLEEYLGKFKAPEVTVSCESDTYSEEQLNELVSQIKCKFAEWDGCELHSITYAGDESNSKENVKRFNEESDEIKYVSTAQFLMDFHTPSGEKAGAFNPDEEYKEYQWWLACDEEGNWYVVSWGY